MSEHPSIETLHDLVDGVLARGAEAGVAAHVRACDACAAELVSLRALLDELHALPRELTPERDLRAGIHARIRSEQAARALPARSVWSSRYALAAAALLLIAASALTTIVVMRGRQQPPAARAAAAATLPELQAEYARAAGELLAALHAQGAGVPPATLRLIEREIAVADRAIAEMQAAITQEPGNSELPRLMLAAYAQKLALLRRASELTNVPTEKT